MKSQFYYLFKRTDATEAAIKAKGYVYNGGAFKSAVLKQFTHILIWKNGGNAYKYSIDSKGDLNELDELPDYNPAD